jgi:hypothetical protein
VSAFPICQAVKAVPYDLRRKQTFCMQSCVWGELWHSISVSWRVYVALGINKWNWISATFSVSSKYSISSKSVEWLVCWYSHPTCRAQHFVALKRAASNSKMHAAVIFICWVRTPDPLRGDDSRPPAASWCQWRRDALRHLKRENASNCYHNNSFPVTSASGSSIT